MEYKAQSERLAEQQQMLAALKLSIYHAPNRLEFIKKEREKLDADEKAIRNLLAFAPARMEALEKEISGLSPFDNSGEKSLEKTHMRRARFEIALSEMLQTIARLPEGSKVRADLIREVENAAMQLRSESGA